VADTFFGGKSKCHWRRAIRTASNEQNWKKKFKKFINFCMKNCRLIVRGISELVNIDRETLWKILTEDLDMRKVCAEMVPNELTKEQKNKGVCR
jgi:energy-converting hydrogenase A subunit M